jgi:hypothetical protein
MWPDHKSVYKSEPGRPVMRTDTDPCVPRRSSAPFARILEASTNLGWLKPDEVYALTAFLLYKNGVIKEDEVLDQTTLPEVKMPNRDGYAIPYWKPGMPRPFPNQH